MSLKDKQSDLDQCCGTEGYTRWGMFRNIVVTDGALFVAKNGGTNGAFWLFDAIASYQHKLLKTQGLREFQLWTLKVTGEGSNRSAVLTCQADSDKKPVVTQKIEYTDFDLDEIKFYVEPLDEKTWVILLTSEH